MSEEMYCLDIKDLNFTFIHESGRIIRTPKKIFLKESDISKWETLMRAKGVRHYKFIKLNEENITTENNNKPIITKTVISDELIRPSRRFKKDN